MPTGWFLVRNRTEEDSESTEVQDAEDKLFGEAPWTTVSKNRLGSTALKNHLGCVLSAKIRSSFPLLQEDIRKRLSESLAENEKLGRPRDNHSARLQYLIALVRPYEEKAKTALERPGLSEKPAMELRREVSLLNREFDMFMRAKGAFWEFEENDIDPRISIKQLHLQTTENSENESEEESASKRSVSNALAKAFPDCSHVGHSTNMIKVIRKTLDDFNGAQLPGVTNPDIYPIIYRQQVQKWTAITGHHLHRVWLAVKNCFEAMLNSVCPPTGGTAAIHKRLLKILTTRFQERYRALEVRCLAECNRETSCRMPQTTDPRFEEELSSWRRLRFWRGLLQVNNSGEGLDLGAIDYYYQCLHLTAQENMVKDVHDVVRVYYKVSMPYSLAEYHDTNTCSR